MVTTKHMGGLLLGVSIGFSAILYFVTRSLGQTTQQLGCMANTPGCVQATSWLSASHVAVGFVSALLSLGIYFYIFHKDVAQPLTREDQLALLSRVLTTGEQTLLRAVAKEDGITQRTLAYKADLTPGRVSQILSQFEEQGIISRKPHGKTYKVYFLM